MLLERKFRAWITTVSDTTAARPNLHIFSRLNAAARGEINNRRKLYRRKTFVRSFVRVKNSRGKSSNSNYLASFRSLVPLACLHSTFCFPLLFRFSFTRVSKQNTLRVADTSSLQAAGKTNAWKLYVYYLSRQCN